MKHNGREKKKKIPPRPDDGVAALTWADVAMGSKYPKSFSFFFFLLLFFSFSVVLLKRRPKCFSQSRYAPSSRKQHWCICCRPSAKNSEGKLFDKIFRPAPKTLREIKWFVFFLSLHFQTISTTEKNKITDCRRLRMLIGRLFRLLPFVLVLHTFNIWWNLNVSCYFFGGSIKISFKVVKF